VAANLTRLTEKVKILWHIVAESCITGVLGCYSKIIFYCTVTICRYSVNSSASRSGVVLQTFWLRMGFHANVMPMLGAGGEEREIC